MTENEFFQKMLAAFPTAEVGQDNDGQLIVYTNMHVVDGEVVNMDGPVG